MIQLLKRSAALPRIKLLKSKSILKRKQSAKVMKTILAEERIYTFHMLVDNVIRGSKVSQH